MFRVILPCLITGFLSAPSLAAELSGRWSGTWRDDRSGHHGPLHATFCRIDDCRYRVTFHGRFWKVVPFRYAIELEVVGTDGGRLQLAGSKRLPLSGEFEMTACADGCTFTATFQSKRYTGRFDLTRAGP